MAVSSVFHLSANSSRDTTFLFLSCSQYEYFNAVLINEVDQEGNNVELGGKFVLQPDDHFNNLSVNLSLSVVQVPTNMYNKGMLATSLWHHSLQSPILRHALLFQREKYSFLLLRG